MKVLITGGTGLLGKYLLENNFENHEVLATYLGDYQPDMKFNYPASFVKADVRDRDLYADLFKEFGPDVIIHTAGVASPDFAEKNRVDAWAINVEATSHLLELAKRHDCSFIYISSNGIYDGDSAPYSEAAIARPVNYYGKLKLQAENIVKDSNLKKAIVRPILMYGWNYAFERKNIVTTAIAKLKKREGVSVYDEVYSNPLYAGNCADVIWKIINKNNFGIYNIAGKDRVSIFELIKKVAEVFELDPWLVTPVKQGYFNELVRRPKDTSYDTAKMITTLKIEPVSLIEGLKAMKQAGEYARAIN